MCMLQAEALAELTGKGSGCRMWAQHPCLQPGFPPRAEHLAGGNSALGFAVQLQQLYHIRARVEHGGIAPSTNSQQPLKQGWEMEAGVWSQLPGNAAQASPGELSSLSPSPGSAFVPCPFLWHGTLVEQNMLARLMGILHDFCSGEKNPLLLSNLISTPANFPFPFLSPHPLQSTN